MAIRKIIKSLEETCTVDSSDSIAVQSQVNVLDITITESGETACVLLSKEDAKEVGQAILDWADH